MEFVPGLIAPRLLVREACCPPAARDHRGLPLACRTEADGLPHVVVVVGDERTLRLEAR